MRIRCKLRGKNNSERAAAEKNYRESRQQR